MDLTMSAIIVGEDSSLSGEPPIPSPSHVLPYKANLSRGKTFTVDWATANVFPQSFPAIAKNTWRC